MAEEEKYYFPAAPALRVLADRIEELEREREDWRKAIANLCDITGCALGQPLHNTIFAMTGIVNERDQLRSQIQALKMAKAAAREMLGWAEGELLQAAIDRLKQQAHAEGFAEAQRIANPRPGFEMWTLEGFCAQLSQRLWGFDLPPDQVPASLLLEIERRLSRAKRMEDQLRAPLGNAVSSLRSYVKQAEKFFKENDHGTGTTSY